MPDIVLKDRSGTPQTYSGTTAVGMDTVDGGVAVFVSRDILNIPWSKITSKPFGELPRLESTELTFTKSEEDLDTYVSALPGVWDIALEESYLVTWDGTEYTCTCKDFTSEGIGIQDTFFLGNTTKFWGAGLGEDTGEPFIIVIGQTSEQYGTAYIETTDTSATHTVSMIPVNGVRRIDQKYLPEMSGAAQVPTFDLAAMGLPAVPLTGEAVQSACDTQKLMEALENGVVKVSLLADIGMEQPVPSSMIAGAANLGGEYQIGFTGLFSVYPVLLSINVYEGNINAQMTMLQKMTM